MTHSTDDTTGTQETAYVRTDAEHSAGGLALEIDLQTYALWSEGSDEAGYTYYVGRRSDQDPRTHRIPACGEVHEDPMFMVYVFFYPHLQAGGDEACERYLGRAHPQEGITMLVGLDAAYRAYQAAKLSYPRIRDGKD
jgi:hypothetical protein